MPENVTVREATEADGPALAVIERQTPLQLGDGLFLIDRGDDYFAAARLMGVATVLIAEVDGVPAGIFCAAPHPAVIGGIDHRMLYIHHARILPFAQNKGLGKLMSDYVRKKYAGKSDSNYFYISPGNAQSQAFARRAENKWSVQPALIDLDTAAMRGPAAGRPATPADAPRIVALVNSTHEAEEMFLPYTVESFSARMARAPKQYSWDRVWLSDGAVVAVWPEGESISVRVTPVDGEATETRGAAVLDFGYEPGGGAELLALLGAWSAWLADRGMASLSLFSSPGTPATGTSCIPSARSAHSTSGRLGFLSPVAPPHAASTSITSTSSRAVPVCGISSLGNCARVKACGTVRVRLKRGWAVGGVVDVHLRLQA